MRPSFDRSYAGTTETLQSARDDLYEVLIAHGLDRVGHDTLVADAQLVVSELISNAVDASPGMAYRVKASINAACVYIEVTNSSTAELPDSEDWALQDVLAPQGRGLSIVRALSETVDVVNAEGEITVAARLGICLS